MNTVNDLVNKMLELFPNAIVEEDGKGELVVYTAMKADDSDNLIEMDQVKYLDTTFNTKEEN